MENDQNLSQQTVKRHKGAIQAIYSVCLVALLLYIIFGGAGLIMKIIVSLVILVAVTLVMAVMVKLHAWPFK